jgi:hypothetical protein
MWDYLRTREGIMVWDSINLSNPGIQWLTPAKDEDGKTYTKPTWQVSNTPSQIITKAEDVKVSIDKEVKRFHVATRMGSQGMSIKVTDGGTRKIRTEVAEAGEGAYHTFNYGDYKNAVIMAPEKQMSLDQYAKEQGW